MLPNPLYYYRKFRESSTWLRNYLGSTRSLPQSLTSSRDYGVGNTAPDLPAPASVPTALNSGVFTLEHDTPSQPLLPSWPPRGLPHGCTTRPSGLPVAARVYLIIAPVGSGKRAFYFTVAHLPGTRLATWFIQPQAARHGTHPFVVAHRATPPSDTTVILLRSYADFLMCDFHWLPQAILFIAPKVLPCRPQDVARHANVLIPYLDEIADVSTVHPDATELVPSFGAALSRVLTDRRMFPTICALFVRCVYLLAALVARYYYK